MVTIENIKPISGAGKLRISDVRVIQQPNQEPWVSMPSRAYEKDGQRKWAPTVEILDDELKQEMCRAVLAEFSKTHSGSKQSARTAW